MFSALTAIAIGLVLPFWLGDLPGGWIAGPCLAVLCCRWPCLRWLPWFVVAWLYSAWQVQGHLAERLQGCSAKVQTSVAFRVATVVTDGRILRLTGRVLAPMAQPTNVTCVLPAGRKLRLSWRPDNPTPNGPARHSVPANLAPGSQWLLQLVLVEPWGRQNPGGFDYERWLLGAGIAATGYVQEGRLLVAAPPAQALESWRSELKKELVQYSQRGALQAIVLGDASLLQNRQWQRLRSSGTLHLLVVSGLHIGLLATLAFVLGRMLARLCPPLIKRLPAARVGALSGIAASGCYLLVTGMQVPGVRAWTMSALAMALLATRKNPWLLFWLAWVVVLMLYPRAGWQQGFYFSFCAVACLLWFFGPTADHRFLLSIPAAETEALPPKPRITKLWFGWLLGLLKLVRVQYALLLGMLPTLFIFGQGLPVAGSAVNLLAVPWVSLVVVPAALLGALLTFFCNGLGQWLLGIANTALGLFECGLALLGQAPVWYPQRLNPRSLLLYTVIAMLALLRGTWRWALLLWLALATLLAPSTRALSTGEFSVQVLDVGQGSSILVSTQSRVLLYDTGPAYPSGFSMARAVVLPTLGALGIDRLHRLVVSHQDLDHAGGVQTILSEFSPSVILRGGKVPSARQHQTTKLVPNQPCQQGQQWQWDGVSFSALHPNPRLPQATKQNDASCVLHIRGSHASALLAGDVSARVENELFKQLPAPVDFMMAPHHGSNSSSSLGLVQRARPKIVVASSGRYNRYGHPHTNVVARYCRIGAQFLTTAEAGAVTWRSDKPRTVRVARQNSPFWRMQLLASSRPDSNNKQLVGCRLPVQPRNGAAQY